MANPNYCAGCGYLLGKCLGRVVEAEGMRFCSTTCRDGTLRHRPTVVKPEALHGEVEQKFGVCGGCGGRVLVKADDPDPALRAAWRAANWRTPRYDGWQRVKCPRCNVDKPEETA